MNRKQKRLLLRILIAAVFFVPLYLVSEGIAAVSLPRPALPALFLIPYLLVGHDILRKALSGVRNGRVFDENFLMTAATAAAIVLGEYGEGVAVMLLYQVGELFQSCAVDKSRRNIAQLMDIRPDYANIEDGGALTQVDPDDVAVGSIIVVQPGEKVPLDGVVAEGVSTLNTAALTGESRPMDVSAGDGVISGSINMTGVLKVRTTKAFEESTASRILELVESAASRKSRSEHFIARFARVYTPAVCGAALALAVLPPLFCTVMGIGVSGGLWREWVLRACTFLVISCPCAVVISVPLSFFAALGGAGGQGILIKGSNYLETLSEVKVVALDKTGTITRGSFSVTGVHHSIMEDERLLEYAALAECHSSHPISRSLQAACGAAPDRRRVTQVQEIGGHGVIAQVDGAVVAVGNEKLMRRLGVKARPCRHAGAVVHVAVDDAYGGHIVISDELKETSAEAVQALRRAGVETIVMLTGDSEAAARSVAEEAGVTEYRAELLPEDKVRCVEELLAGCGRRRLAFVGDGINDAPVLARADVGIAMGALGSDAAIEAADVVLMDDDPRKIAKAIAISRKCMRIVRQNIVFALGVKLACLLLGALGLAGMWAAIVADVGVMVLAVLNAVRCLFVKNI